MECYFAARFDMADRASTPQHKMGLTDPRQRIWEDHGHDKYPGWCSQGVGKKNTHDCRDRRWPGDSPGVASCVDEGATGNTRKRTPAVAYSGFQSRELRNSRGFPGKA